MSHRVALCVGIDNYPNHPLNGCEDDAEKIANLIEHNDRLPRDKTGSKNFTVVLKKDIMTRGALKGEIRDIFENANDIALFYFSGHGYADATGGYLVTPDHEENDIGVPMSYIMEIVKQSKATDRIVILDCCQSGAFGSRLNTLMNISEIADGMVILTASGQSQSSLQVNGQGLFTNLLLEALKGGAANLSGDITPGSIYAYIDQAMGPLGQRPLFKANVSRFISLRKALPPIPANILSMIPKYFSTPTTKYKLDPSHEFTNDPNYKLEKKGIPIKKNVTIFKGLQKMVSVGLVVPVGEEHMYFAAQKEKSCKLTPLGQHYWRLMKENLL